MKKHFWLSWTGIGWGLLWTYSWFSYGLTAPNLILSSWDPYWRWQLWMWRTFFNDRATLSWTYGGLLVAIFGWYLVGLWWAKNHQLLKIKIDSLSDYLKIGVLSSLFILPLIVSNNALSYDVFNYIFNAKMVVYYHANPHVQTALDFARDDWTRFMHNTHTPAPYGYGWTIISLAPYALGMGKFLPTWIIFRLMSVISLGLLAVSLRLAAKNTPFKLSQIGWLILFLNPLLLIEIISNSHNDLWMMVPAVLSLALIATPKPTASQRPSLSWQKIVVSLILLAISISIKLASVALIPLWGWLVINPKLIRRWLINWPLMASILMFVPLFHPQSKYFLPWYLTWSLVWIPLFNFKQTWTKWWTGLLVVASISSLSRYLPYLWAGNYEGQIVFHQQLITWIPLGITIIFILLWAAKNKLQSVK